MRLDICPGSAEPRLRMKDPGAQNVFAEPPAPKSKNIQTFTWFRALDPCGTGAGARVDPRHRCC